jgi:hypothetical protein
MQDRAASEDIQVQSSTFTCATTLLVSLGPVMNAFCFTQQAWAKSNSTVIA